MRLGPDFSRFGHDFLLEKIFLSCENQMLDKIVFRQSQLFFNFFSTACFFDIISSTCMSRRFWKVLLALILGGSSKSHVFEKIYT